MTYFKQHFLALTIIPLLIILIVTAYYRFLVARDYIAAFEGDCDPATESCYVECVDDDCTEEYYYTIIERHAAELYELCGPDILDCDDAYVCQPEVPFCEISYCDPADEEVECVGPNTTEL